MERNHLEDRGYPNPRQAEVDRTRDATITSMRAAAERQARIRRPPEAAPERRPIADAPFREREQGRQA